MSLLAIGNIYNSADDAEIFVRFQGSCLVAAKDIKAEDPQTTNHAERESWADAILAGEISAVRARVRKILRFSIATNSTFQTSGTEVTDNDIGFMVSTALSLVSNL